MDEMERVVLRAGLAVVGLILQIQGERAIRHQHLRLKATMAVMALTMAPIAPLGAAAEQALLAKMVT